MVAEWETKKKDRLENAQMRGRMTVLHKIVSGKTVPLPVWIRLETCYPIQMDLDNVQLPLIGLKEVLAAVRENDEVNC